MSAKFKQCATCYFNNRSPEICDGCHRASEYLADDSEPPIDDDIDALTEFTQQEIL